MSQAKVSVNKSSINTQMQTSADKARNNVIDTVLVLSVIQVGYVTIYWLMISDVSTNQIVRTN